jgi:metabolite-proton symporter
MAVELEERVPDRDAKRSVGRAAATALAGTSIEWYDFFLYGTAAALVFPTQYFPADMPPMVALIASFSTFAVGFIARPVGGIIFGHFGDRVGRKRALMTALMVMGVGTTLIGCLPTYASIGAAAPILLVLLRFVQGLAIGGQWGGAVLMVTENAPPGRRGFFGSFAQIGAPVGVVTANLAFLLITATTSPDAFNEWGWRIPFLASVVLIGLSLYVQVALDDTQVFTESARDTTAPKRSPVLEALRLYPKEIALAAGAFLSIQVTFYILVTFVIAYGTRADGLALPRSTMLIGVMAGAVAMVPTLLISAAISDRYGRRGIYMLGAALVGVWAFVMFPLIDTGSLLWICVAIGVGQAFVAMMYGPQAAFLSEMFSTHVRYSGASLGYQFGSILGGGFAPVIATALLDVSGGTFWISVYLAGASVVTILSTLFLKETYRADMRVTVGAVP